MTSAADRARRDDVACWQAGELSEDELRRRHPGSEVDDALAAHARLLAWAQAPVPDPALAWPQVAAALPAQGPRRSRRLRRPAVAAIVAAVLASPAVSYALAPDAVRSGIRQVADLFTDGRDDRRRPDVGAESDDTTVTPGPGATPRRPTPLPIADSSDPDASERYDPAHDPSTDGDDPTDDDTPDHDDPDTDEPDENAPEPLEDPDGTEEPTDDADRAGEPVSDLSTDASPGD